MVNEKQISKATQEKIQELQIMQQRLTLFAAQKQQLQLQTLDVEAALKELEGTKAPAYKLIGELLIEKPITELKKELNDKKSDIELHLKTIEKQENKIKESALEIQKEVTKSLEKQ
jgi:prefoldin beta subunit